MPAGRPSDYSQELADKICEKIVMGNSLRSICSDESIPCIATIFNWFRTHPEFLEQYEIATSARSDTLVEEMLDISDDGTNDWMEKFGKEGEPIGWQVNSEHIQRSRLRVDTRKWIASKLKPKKYGEKQTLEHTGKDGKDLTPDAAEIASRILTGIAAAKRSSGNEPPELDREGQTGTATA